MDSEVIHETATHRTFRETYWGADLVDALREAADSIESDITISQEYYKTALPVIASCAVMAVNDGWQVQIVRVIEIVQAAKDGG